jgi:hypothetical protein
VSARYSDPSSSHSTVASIKSDGRLRDLILAIFAANSTIELSDSDLTDLVNKYRSAPVQRNVVARARSFVEAEGLVERVGEVYDEGRRRTLLVFKLAENAKVPTVLVNHVRVKPAVVPASIAVRVINGEVAVLNMKTGSVLASRYQWTLKDLERYAQALSVGG